MPKICDANTFYLKTTLVSFYLLKCLQPTDNSCIFLSVKVLQPLHKKTNTERVKVLGVASREVGGTVGGSCKWRIWDCRGRECQLVCNRMRLRDVLHFPAGAQLGNLAGWLVAQLLNLCIVD